MVVICRFFSGAGMGAILVSTMTIMVEEWPKKTRAIFMGILSIAIPVGIFSAGVIDYFVSSWRQAFLVGIIAFLIAFMSFWLLRESPKWKQERQEVVQHHKKEDKSFRRDHRMDLISGSIIFGTMLIGLWAVFSWIPTWIQGLITEGDGQKERGLSMMMLGMGGLIGGFLSGWVSNVIGLRRSMLVCFSVCAALSFLLFKTNTKFSAVIHAEILILAFFFGLRAIRSVMFLYSFQLRYLLVADRSCDPPRRESRERCRSVAFASARVRRLGRPSPPRMTMQSSPAGVRTHSVTSLSTSRPSSSPSWSSIAMSGGSSSSRGCRRPRGTARTARRRGATRTPRR